MKVFALLILLFAIIIGAMPASAAYTPAHATTLAAPTTAAHETGTSVARGVWKQKIVSRIVQSKTGRWMLRKISRWAAPVEGSTNTVSLIAGIMGILSIVFLLTASAAGILSILALLTGIAALVLGIVGLGEVNKKNEGGKGWALTGIIGGSLTLLVFLIGVLFIAAFLF